MTEGDIGGSWTSLGPHREVVSLHLPKKKNQRTKKSLNSMVSCISQVRGKRRELDCTSRGSSPLRKKNQREKKSLNSIYGYLRE